MDMENRERQSLKIEQSMDIKSRLHVSLLFDILYGASQNGHYQIGHDKHHPQLIPKTVRSHQASRCHQPSDHVDAEEHKHRACGDGAGQDPGEGLVSAVGQKKDIKEASVGTDISAPVPSVKQGGEGKSKDDQGYRQTKLREPEASKGHSKGIDPSVFSQGREGPFFFDKGLFRFHHAPPYLPPYRGDTRE